MKKMLLIALFVISVLIFAASIKPFVSLKDCVGCGDCVTYCPVNAITIKNEKAIIDQKKCIDCKLCVTSCTYNAIK